MTIALIVACKDSYYIVSDTLTRCLGAGNFSLNAQKTFFSPKHKIAMCISGDATLKPENGMLDEKNILYTDFILKDFFSNFDNEPGISLMSEFNGRLKSFFESHYPGYLKPFQKGVGYFYGGFEVPVEGSFTTVICQHAIKRYDIRLFDFNNGNVKDRILKAVKQDKEIAVLIGTPNFEDYLRVFYEKKKNEAPEYVLIPKDSFKDLGKLNFNGERLDWTNDTEEFYEKIYESINSREGICQEIFEEEYRFSEENDHNPYFTSMPEGLARGMALMLDAEGAPSITTKEFLVLENYRGPFLHQAIPNACELMNSKNPYTIGKYIHYLQVFPSDAAGRYQLKYEVDAAQQVRCTPKPEDFPEFIRFKSVADSSHAFKCGQFTLFSLKDGSSLKRPTPVEQLSESLHQLIQNFHEEQQKTGISNQSYLAAWDAYQQNSWPLPLIEQSEELRKNIFDMLDPFS